MSARIHPTAVVDAGARLAGVPVGREGMDLDMLESVLSRTPPKFIYVVPDFQNPSGRRWSVDRRRALAEIAARFEVPVIEDAAQSFGARYRDRHSCNLSTLACTSFFPSKPLGCYGDGGAIFTVRLKPWTQEMAA